MSNDDNRIRGRYFNFSAASASAMSWSEATGTGTGDYTAIQNLILRPCRCSTPDPFDASQATAGIAGLTRSPRPVPGSSNPAFSKLSAAFRSLSFVAPQSGQIDWRSDKLSESFLVPHPEHRFDDRNHLLTSTSSAPYHWHLYASFLRKPGMPASARAHESRRFGIMPLTFRFSLDHHPACRLGYRRCAFVMSVAPHVEYPRMKPRPSAIQPHRAAAVLSPAP